MANNPVMLGISQAKAIWPEMPIDCIVSVGTGRQRKEVGGIHSISLLLAFNSV